MPDCPTPDMIRPGLAHRVRDNTAQGRVGRGACHSTVNRKARGSHGRAMAGSMMAALACMAVVLMAGAYGPPATAATQEGTLAVTAAGQANARTYTRAALLAMPQQRTVTLAVDPEHIGPQVEAVPLAAMTGSGATPDVLRLGAVDGWQQDFQY